MKEKEYRAFLMRGGTRTGLAFFVDDRHLLTCAHVVAACFPPGTPHADLREKVVSCEFLTEASERAFNAVVLVYREALAANTGTASEQRNSDIALLRVVTEPDTLPLQPDPVVLSSPKLGSSVVLMGATTDDYGKIVVSHGRITVDVEDGRYYATVLGNNRARPGYSGGPVAEEKTRYVVGMVQKAPHDGGDARFVSSLVMRAAVQDRLALQTDGHAVDLARAGADSESRIALLQSLPLGPAVDRYLITASLVRAFAGATDFRKARDVISEANTLLMATLPKRPHNSHAYVISFADLPGSERTPMGDFWPEAFDQACMLGPRMVGALILAAPMAMQLGAKTQMVELIQKLRSVT